MPLNCRVVSIPRMLCGSSTTQIDAASRLGSRQYWQISPSLMLLQNLAQAQLVLHIQNRLRQLLGIVTAAAQQVERQPLRGFLSDARQMFEFGDQAGQRFGEIRHGLEHAPAAGPARP